MSKKKGINKQLKQIIKELDIKRLDDIIDEKRYSIRELRSIMLYFGHPSNLQYYYKLRHDGVIKDEYCDRGIGGTQPVKFTGSDVKQIIVSL